MYLGRLGVRASLAAVGVLASAALMAAPSWAAKGGNSANAKLCHGGYPGVLLAQDGSAFKNAGKCTSYAAKGGQIAGVNAAAQPASGGRFEASFSGFGLRPESTIVVEILYSGASVVASPKAAENGTFSTSSPGQVCELLGSKVIALDIEAHTAAGTEFRREFPPPTGC